LTRSEVEPSEVLQARARRYQERHPVESEALLVDPEAIAAGAGLDSAELAPDRSVG